MDSTKSWVQRRISFPLQRPHTNDNTDFRALDQAAAVKLTTRDYLLVVSNMEWKQEIGPPTTTRLQELINLRLKDPIIMFIPCRSLLLLVVGLLAG